MSSMSFVKCGPLALTVLLCGALANSLSAAKSDANSDLKPEHNLVTDRPVEGRYTLLYKGQPLGSFEHMELVKTVEKTTQLVVKNGDASPLAAAWLNDSAPAFGQAVFSSDWLQWSRGKNTAWQCTRALTNPLEEASGLFFRPEVDDEVLIVFMSGDLRTPYLIGALYGDGQRPPQADDDAPETGDKTSAKAWIKIDQVPIAIKEVNRECAEADE